MRLGKRHSLLAVPLLLLLAWWLPRDDVQVERPGPGTRVVSPSSSVTGETTRSVRTTRRAPRRPLAIHPPSTDTASSRRHPFEVAV